MKEKKEEKKEVDGFSYNSNECNVRRFEELGPSHPGKKIMCSLRIDINLMAYKHYNKVNMPQMRTKSRSRDIVGC